MYYLQSITLKRIANSLILITNSIARSAVGVSLQNLHKIMKSCGSKLFAAEEIPGKQRYVCIDVETTGLSAARGGRIIEIGAVVIEKSHITSEYQTLVDPGTRITRQAQRVHGITSDMLAGKPKPEEVFPAISQLIRDAALVAHNAIFDVSFLRYEFGRLGLSFNNRYTCTLRMSKRLFPNLCDHRLKTVYCHLFGATPEGSMPHRALDDARMATRVWMEMMKK